MVSDRPYGVAEFGELCEVKASLSYGESEGIVEMMALFIGDAWGKGLRGSGVSICSEDTGE